MRICPIFAAVLLAVSPIGATTLLKLSLDEMIQQSTSIVRAKITGSYTAPLGRDVYTYYQVQILETLKAGGTAATVVAVPGGTAKGVRQMAAGAPTLNAGQEYILFLWTSRSGMTQIIGLSQGLFVAMQSEAGDTVLVRPAASELMLDQAGRVVADHGVTMKLADLKTEIQKALGK
jgi:hypothetical protein